MSEAMPDKILEPNLEILREAYETFEELRH